MTGAELHVLLSRVALGNTPEDRDEAWNAIADEFAKRSQWIDPQRLVDLAKRYTDETGHGWAGIQFSDVSDGWDNWTANTPEGNPGSKTANDALNAAEAEA